MWDDWRAIEAAQRAADEAAQRRAAPPENGPGRPSEPDPDSEAAAAIREAAALAGYGRPPTTPGGPQPTNPDGTARDGYWVGGVWRERPQPGPADRLRALLRDLRTWLDD